MTAYSEKELFYGIFYIVDGKVKQHKLYKDA